MKTINRIVLQGDVKDKIKEINDNSIDLICTDPPYGYSFMNKDWDKVVISSDVWRECLRVLKPGSFAFVMSAPRQDVLSHMIVNLTDAGFETGFTSMYWAYASGFPKAMNVSKAVDKKLGVDREVIGIEKGMGKQNPEWNGIEQGRKENSFKSEYEKTKPTSPQAKKLNGAYAGFQPKPAVEVILVCMKPLEQKNYVEQAMDNGKGVTWFDDCRIPYDGTQDKRIGTNVKYGEIDYKTKFGQIKSNQICGNLKGRFPANLIVSDGVLDVGKRTKSQKTSSVGVDIRGGSYNDSTKPIDLGTERDFNDEGDFSRYFDLDSWEAQFIITPKPSKSEKNEGLELLEPKPMFGNYGDKSQMGWTDAPSDNRKGRINNRQNFHPTVKPVSLFKYLVTLGSRPDDMVLDPFMGSGTTAIACEKLARNWIGIEINPEYREIIEARVDKYRKQERLF